MVNVPGRSKACNTCRRRKVACTLEKPHCQRCWKAHIACAGYERERVFVIYCRPANVPAEQRSIGEANGDAPHGQRRLAQNGAFVSRLSGSSARLPQEVAAYDVHQQQLLAQFLHVYLPSVSANGGAGARQVGIGGRAWFHLLPAFPSLPPCLSASVLALCTAFIGRRHHDEVLLRQSLIYHGRALWALQKALWDARAAYQDETLAACMVLTVYEMTECPSESNRGWISHMAGCAQLIEQRGPEAHVSDVGYQLFAGFRIAGLNEAIVNGRHTYLSDPAWLSTPWRGRSKPRLHQLLDITALLAAELARTRTLDPRHPAQLFSTALDIIDRCWHFEASLRHFDAELDHDSDGPLYWDVPAAALYQAVGLAVDPPTTVAFEFDTLLTGYTCVLDWTTAMLLWLVLTEMYHVLGVHLPPHLPPIERSLNLTALTHQICQAVPYFLQDSMGTLGASLCAIPLVAIIEILQRLPDYEREVTWARGVMQHIRGRGMRLMAEVDRVDGKA